MIVLITGCSSGIGLATSVYLAQQGMTVYASMRNLEKRNELVASANNAGVELNIVQLDVTNDGSVKSAVDAIMEREGRIDVLVNNAGYGLMGPAECVSISQAKAEFEVNFFGLLRVTDAVLPYMRKQRSGHIINISSIAGLRSMPSSDLYNASKYAVEGLTEAMAPTLQLMGIKMTLIEPGPVGTKFISSSMVNPADFKGEEVYKHVHNKMSSGREERFKEAQNPEEIAALIHQAITTEQPFRIQTSDWVREHASAKLSDLDGRAPIADYIEKLRN